LRAAQSCHALRAFSEEHPELDKLWYETSNNLVVLEVENEQALKELDLVFKWERVPHTEFREPDLDNELTAICAGPTARPWVSNIRLALRDVA